MTEQDIGRAARDLDTPVLIADLDVMERNIERMAQVITRDAGVRWRPHTKAMKSPAIARKLLDAGATGITCAKLGEAEVMAAAGIDDILIANQIVGPTKIARLVALRGCADVIVAVDAVSQESLPPHLVEMHAESMVVFRQRVEDIFSLFVPIFERQATHGAPPDSLSRG